MLYLSLAGGAERLEGATLAVTVRPGQARFSIGRDPVCDWAIPDRTLALSARHCEIVAGASGWILRDLSTNGTFLNGASTRMAADHPLRDGDRFDAGPYTVAVRWNPADVLPAEGDASSGAATPPARSRSVEDTDTHWSPPAGGRGRDPAAMAAAMLPPEPEQDLDMTRIRLAPSRPAASAASAASAKSAASGPIPMPPIRPGPVISGPVPVRPDAAPAPAVGPAIRAGIPEAVAPIAPVVAVAPVPAQAVPAAPVPSAAAGSPDDPAPWLEALADGLGLPPQALAGPDAAERARQVGRLLRSTVETWRLLLDEQARARQVLGSRRSSDLAAASILQMAGSTEEALKALLRPGSESAISQAGAGLVEHQARMLTGVQAMLSQTGSQLAPEALAALVPGTDASQQLALYATLWQRLGVAPGDLPWAAGYARAAMQRLASDYDRA